ncbi:Radical SAM superfamily enzyme YgiQ, UPF0313 family [Caloramator quimbayensis]|uniref:Radical SAM superfamily enzyme YgiQ, UPF0313 family n=1 Tax=Caloramator quimbayensis TaxID=1147123 RepID=A0A1T4XNN5_9CLOT|nr:B12-binding domain-containing radical SAM protein [Caloramator quimbayensis]SKA90721.1 Radical SAM superfamily enzyme YgiQ, UPF0313 family [Caloramator quimbayensis]
MNIVLASLNSKYIHSNLAIRYIKSYCSEYNIKLFEGTINENILDIVERIIDLKVDVIGFSCYIWNIESTLKVCSTLKKINKDLIIILGGPEVSFDGESIIKKYDYIDYIIEGEGEVTFKELIDTIFNNKNLYSVKGIVFKDGDKIIKNEQRKLIENLDILPFPYRNEIPDKIVYYEASRGCPFNCSYCLSSTIKGVRYFDLERVKKELKFFIDNEVKLVKFVDRTFNANKNFSKAIWQFLIENAKSTTFHFEISADLLDEESFEILKSAPKNLFQFEIGVQTTNIEVLKIINRRMDFEKVKENIKRIKKFKNIHCHLDLIAGLPTEDIDSFKKSFDMCMDIKPDVLQLGFLKVLKGSAVEKEIKKYDIKYADFPPYQVLSTKDMSYINMEKLNKIEKVFDIYYNSGNFKLTMEYLLDIVPSFFNFFNEFSIFLNSKDFYTKNFDLKDKFYFIYEFLIEKIDKELIKDLLLHDYIITSKKPYAVELFADRYCDNKKEIIIQNKDNIYIHFKCTDFKKVICFKVKYKIILKNEGVTIENQDALVFFNLENGEYFYI